MDDTTDQAEALARAICVADDRDPDALVPKPAGATSEEPAGEVPRWRLYEPQARRIIAAQGAMLGG